MKQRNELLLKSFILICMIILSNSISNLLDGIGHYFFYNIFYGFIISVCVPIYFFRKEDNGDLSLLGIKRLRPIDYIIIIGFVVFSVSGQLANVKLMDINLGVLPLSIFPLIMTTFSEEFLFRGFLQIRFEKAFGFIPAILLSGLFFDIYHLGYPSFRTFQMMILLFFVGIMFALAFKLSKNNLIVAYFVNLPNAYVIYLLKTENFPKLNFNVPATVISIFLIIITGFALIKGLNINRNKLQDSDLYI